MLTVGGERALMKASYDCGFVRANFARDDGVQKLLFVARVISNWFRGARHTPVRFNAAFIVFCARKVSLPSGKIPYSIEMKDDSPFVFAGLWERWQDPETQEWLPPNE
jgi:hypothetical protein